MIEEIVEWFQANSNRLCIEKIKVNGKTVSAFGEDFLKNELIELAGKFPDKDFKLCYSEQEGLTQLIVF